MTFLTLYHSSKLITGELEARTFLTKKVRKLLAPGALDVLLHLETHQGYTIPELVKSLKDMSWQTADRVHKSLLDVGLVREVAKVERRFMSRHHRPVPVFLLEGAPPEAAHEAMRRYAELPREGHARERPTQATIDEAIAAIKCIMGNDREATLRELIHQLKVKGITYQTARAAAQQLNAQEGLKIWA